MRWYALCLVVPAVWLAIGGCPPEAPPDWSVPDDLEAEVEAPVLAVKGESVVLTARLNHQVDALAVLYRWFQTYGRAVQILGVDSAEASFLAPSLPTDQVLRFRLDVQLPDGTIRSAVVAVLVAADPDYELGETVEENGDGTTDQDPYPQVRLTTGKGDITIELDRIKAPLTVNNFLRYVDDGFYDGTIFHRVIPDFIIQGGGYEPGLEKKEPRSPITSEAASGLKNERGTIAMARRSDPDSATSQFYINLVDNPSLDYEPGGSAGYAAFGRVVQGMAAVDLIANVATESRDGMDDVPVIDVLLVRVERVTETSDGGTTDSGGYVDDDKGTGGGGSYIKGKDGG